MQRIFLALLVLGLSCRTVRVDYVADVETKEHEQARISYSKSIEVNEHMIGCIVTGIFYGGWCWVYTLMPFSSQEQEVREAAKRRARASGLSGADIIDEWINKNGYNNQPPRYSLKWYGDAKKKHKNILPKIDEIDEDDGTEPAHRSEIDNNAVRRIDEDDEAEETRERQAKENRRSEAERQRHDPGVTISGLVGTHESYFFGGEIGYEVRGLEAFFGTELAGAEPYVLGLPVILGAQMEIVHRNLDIALGGRFSWFASSGKRGIVYEKNFSEANGVRAPYMSAYSGHDGGGAEMVRSARWEILYGDVFLHFETNGYDSRGHVFCDLGFSHNLLQVLHVEEYPEDAAYGKPLGIASRYYNSAQPADGLGFDGKYTHQGRITLLLNLGVKFHGR